MSIFGFFKKKEQNTNSVHPIAEMYADLDKEKKMSIINLLFLTTAANDKDDNNDAEIDYLNSYVRILGVRQDESSAYLRQGGPDRVVADLKTLSVSQKELLGMAVWGILGCNGRPNESGVQFAVGIMDKIGVNNERYLSLIRESKMIMSKFGI